MTFHKCVCGSEVTAWQNDDGTWKAVCMNCELRTADHETIEDARIAWNRCFEKELPVEYVTVKNRRYQGLKNRYAILNVGDTFSRYKTLAGYLGEKWPPRSWTQQKAMKNRWAMFFNWEWDNRSRKITITEVYEYPKLKGQVYAPRHTNYQKELSKAIEEGREKEWRREHFRNITQRYY